MDKTFTIRGEYITLGQLLKAVGVVDQGWEVKIYLAENIPQVNGEDENRRGKKLRDKDVIVLPDGSTITIHAPDAPGSPD